MISTQDTAIRAARLDATASNHTLLGLALVGTLGVTFEPLLDFMDQWGQPSKIAQLKRLYGDHRVYLDGVRLGSPEDTRDRWGDVTLTATQLGRLACAAHVFLQTGAHVAASVAICRLVGYRIPLGAVLAGAAINGPMHFALDRGAWLEKLAHLFGKDEYLRCLTVVREEGEPAHRNGEGTAWNALDRSGHKLVGWFATATTVALALKFGGRK